MNRPLKDYMTLVNKIRAYVEIMPLANAVDQSVEECIKKPGKKGLQKVFQKDWKMQFRS